MAKVIKEGNILVIEMTDFSIKVTRSKSGWDGSIWFDGKPSIVSLGNVCIASLLVDLANKAANHIREVMIENVSHEFERYFIEEGYPEEFPSDFKEDEDD